jgi:hypothetical protein
MNTPPPTRRDYAVALLYLTCLVGLVFIVTVLSGWKP